MERQKDATKVFQEYFSGKITAEQFSAILKFGGYDRAIITETIRADNGKFEGKEITLELKK